MTTSVNNLPAEYIECRALLHAWEEIPYDGEAPQRWRRTNQRSTTILLFRCLRCSTKRYDVWANATGALAERAYRTPEGYALPKGKGRKVLVRKAYIERLARPKRLRRVS